MAGTAYNDESRQAQLYKFNANEVLEGEGLPTTLNLMNVNARLYNPALGMFLAVDPQGQFASPYLAFGNNPVNFIDPDGELAWFVPLIIGAVVNVRINAWQGNIDSFWDGLGYAAVGAAAGALGAGLGTGISAALGGTSTFGAGFAAAFSGSGALAGAGITGVPSSFFTGAAIGGGAGFGSGFVGGLGNGLIESKNFNDALVTGIKYGLVGGVSEGLVGGLAGGINAAKDGRYFWNGKPQKMLVEYNLDGMPIITQKGSKDCLLGCLEGVEKLNGGSRTQNDFADILEKSGAYDPSTGSNTLDGIKAAGFDVSTPTKGASPHKIGRLMGKGNPSIAAESSSQVGLKHAVVPTKIQVWQRGATKVFFKTWVMNPANGRIVPRHGAGFWENNIFFNIMLNR